MSAIDEFHDRFLVKWIETFTAAQAFSQKVTTQLNYENFKTLTNKNLEFWASELYANCQQFIRIL